MLETAVLKKGGVEVRRARGGGFVCVVEEVLCLYFPVAVLFKEVVTGVLQLGHGGQWDVHQGYRVCLSL